MPIKCQSNQIRTEHYIYTLAAGENILLPIKARPDEAIIVHSVGLYNPSQDNYTHVYWVMTERGQLVRLAYTAALNTVTVQRWADDVYLKAGRRVRYSHNSERRR